MRTPPDEPTLVMMAGPAGAGKSTLAGAICAWLGEACELLPEEAIFERHEFEEVGEAFRSKTFPDTQMMLVAYNRIFARARDARTSIVADWSCIGMIEDLPCAQPDRAALTTRVAGATPDLDVLVSHGRDVLQMWGGRAVLLDLHVRHEIAGQRALADRGTKWFVRHLHLEKTPADPVGELVRHERQFDQRKQAIVEAHRASGWEIHQLDAEQTSDDVLDDAITVLAR
jgi:hypothetical protein